MTPKTRSNPYLGTGLGQLTLVEHALCPLDARISLVENLVHEAGYFFMDRQRQWRKANVRVTCPLGLSANDELILWGLLALTLRDRNVDGEFHATPHFCLRQLGLVDCHGRRGGRQYQHFAEAVERLSLVRYRNDFFYDPVRAEHRKVSFGFFSYSLPLHPESSRAWRLVWDPIFFEIVKAINGHLRFDLALYRRLDPASRRLFLVLAKIFHRRTTTPAFELRHLAVDVLGFSPAMLARDLRRKVTRCICRLHELGVVGDFSEEVLFAKKRPGVYVLQMKRGAFFEKGNSMRSDSGIVESALHEPLQRIGFRDDEIPRILRKYPPAQLREWIDITLAALERNGLAFFSKSPQAYFLDNVKHASVGARTPPDWWREMRKAELETIGRRKRATGRPFEADWNQPTESCSE